MGKHLKWGEPPVKSAVPRKSTKKYRKKTYATRLKEKPGQWAVIYEGDKVGSVPTSLRGPEFERKHGREMVGRKIIHRVYVRYIGNNVDVAPIEELVSHPIDTVDEYQEMIKSMVADAVRQTIRELQKESVQ
jgi:hypothetical protein